jgi:hypothetical protein
MPVAWTGDTAPARTEMIGGRKHLFFDVTGGGVEAASELSLSVPYLCTLTLLHMVRATAGSSTSLDPDIGNVASFAANSINHLAANDTAASQIRNSTRVPLVCPTGVLVIRPTPDATVTSLRVRVVLVEGHEE